MIKITNSYFERINNPAFQELLKKPFPVKTAYWLGRVVEKLRQVAGHYFEAKQRLIEKYAEKGPDGKTSLDKNGFLKITDFDNFVNELQELQKIEIELRFNPIKLDLDKAPDLTVEEMGILLPLIEVEGD